MLLFLQFLVGSLAVWQIVEVLHHAEISKPLRLWAHKVVLADAAVPPLIFLRFFCRAFVCPYCLSFWVAGIVAFPMFIGWPYFYGWCWLVWTFAMSRAANLANDLTFEYNRTPGRDVSDAEDPVSDTAGVATTITPIEDDPDNDYANSFRSS